MNGFNRFWENAICVWFKANNGRKLFIIWKFFTMKMGPIEFRLVLIENGARWWMTMIVSGTMRDVTCLKYQARYLFNAHNHYCGLVTWLKIESYKFKIFNLRESFNEFFKSEQNFSRNEPESRRKLLSFSFISSIAVSGICLRAIMRSGYHYGFTSKPEAEKSIAFSTLRVNLAG